jgi:hypothetical protein
MITERYRSNRNQNGSKLKVSKFTETLLPLLKKCYNLLKNWICLHHSHDFQSFSNHWAWQSFALCIGSNLLIKQAHLTQELWTLGSRPTCLQPVLAGGSIVNSSTQLQPYKSLSRIQLKCCRAGPLPSLADWESRRAADWAEQQLAY